MKSIQFFCLLGAVITAPHLAHGTASFVGWSCVGIATLSLVLNLALKER